MTGKIVLLLLTALLGVSGKPNQVKVVGGQEALRNEFPSLVQIQLNGALLCGGTIYSREWVITAAHCAMAGPMRSFTIIAGEHNNSAVDGSEQSRQVVHITWHPLYQSPDVLEFENDVAVMQVYPPFTFNQYVKAAPVPTAGFAPPTNAIIAGWGTLTEGGIYPTALQKVTVPVTSDAACDSAYGGNAVAPSMICAGSAGMDSCTGDSGGPLYCRNGTDTELLLCGVISWGLGCARPNYPGVNTEMSYFSNWTYQSAHEVPIVDQTVGCGGALVGASGKVAYKLGQSYNNNEKCVWSIRTNDRENVRLTLESDGLGIGDSITVTEFDYATGKAVRTQRLSNSNSVLLLSGPLVLVTFSSDAGMTGTGFSLLYQAEGAIDATQLNYLQHHISNITGSFHYPSTTLSYYSNELSTILINPESIFLSFKVDFIDLEASNDCSLDVLNVHTLGEEGFTSVQSLCGANPGSAVNTEGPVLLVLRTDESVTRSGYTISWSAVN